MHTHAYRHRDVCCSGLDYFSVDVDEIESGIVVIVTRTHKHALNRTCALAAARRCEHVTSLTFSYSSNNPAETLHMLCAWWFPLLLLLVSRLKSISCYLPPKKWKPNVLICQPAFSHRFKHSCEIVSSAVDSNQNAHATENKVNCSILHARTVTHIFTHGGFIKWNCFCYNNFRIAQK